MMSGANRFRPRITLVYNHLRVCNSFALIDVLSTHSRCLIKGSTTLTTVPIDLPKAFTRPDLTTS